MSAGSMYVHLEVGIVPDWLPLDPRQTGPMMGGTERLALRLAYNLASKGHTVSFRGGGVACEHQGVHFLDSRPRPLACDVLVAVQCEAPAELRSHRRVAWPHSVQLPRDAGWDAVVTVSPYQTEVIRTRLPAARLVSIRPGCDVPARTATTRDRFLYASSPDRGLHRLLAMWPELWQAFHVPLSIAYDPRAAAARHGQRSNALGARMREILRLLDQPGIVVHGPLQDDELAALRARSMALLYPHDPVLPHSELLSLSVLEACAAGCPPILAPVDCFPSEYGQVARLVEPDRPVYETAAWRKAIEDVLDPALDYHERARTFALGRSWETFEETWEALLRGLLREPATAAPTGGQAWCVLAMGSDWEEAIASRSLLQAAHDRGHTVQVLTMDEAVSQRLQGPWRRLQAHGARQVFEVLAAGWDRIVLLSTREHLPILRHLPRLAGAARVVAVEHSFPTWLGGREEAGLVHGFIFCFPEVVWSIGCESGLPGSLLPTTVQQQLRCVGVSTDVRPGISTDEPTILLDVGRPGTWPSELVEALSAALAQLRHGGIRVLSLGEHTGFLELDGCLPRDDAADALSRADLFISAGSPHLIALAWASGTPVLCLTAGGIFLENSFPEADVHAHILCRAGLVEHLPGSLHVTSYVHMVRAMLQEGRREPVGGGAPGAVLWVEGLGSGVARLDAGRTAVRQ